MSQRVPLTFQQQWLLNVMQQCESWRCVAAYAFRMRGALNVAFLRRSLEEVVGRHGTLRMRLVTCNEVPLQEICDLRLDALQRVPVRGGSTKEIEANARLYVEEICNGRMELAAAPFWRVRLLQLSEQEHWLVLAMHRLIGDCASIGQVYREIRFSYDELLEGRSASVELPAQYADYAIWQQQSSEQWLQRHQPYWERRLAGADPIQWHGNKGFSSSGHSCLAKMSCSFGKALTASLHELARTVRTLAATLVMTVYIIVLWRWCRQNDFILPCNVAGRQSEQKSAVGYFSHILFMRISMSGTETFRELLARVSGEFFSSLMHEDFGRLALQRPQLLVGTLFQWMTWHHDEVSGAASAAMSGHHSPPTERVTVRDFGEGLTLVPPGMTALELTFFDTAEGIRVFGSYRTDMFDAETMQRFNADLLSAAERFAADPDCPVAMS